MFLKDDGVETWEDDGVGDILCGIGRVDRAGDELWESDGKTAVDSGMLRVAEPNIDDI